MIFIPFLYSILLLFPLYLSSNVPQDALAVDGIKYVIYATEGTEIITKRDVGLPSLTGEPKKEEDILLERLVFLDAKKFKINPDDEAIDKYLAMIAKQNNISVDQMNQVFLSAGRNPEEGKKELGMMQAVGSMLNFKISSNLIVSNKAIAQYYQDHPEVRDPQYLVEYATIPFAQDKEEQYQRLFNGYYDAMKLVWSDPFWVIKNELDQSKLFIADLKIGEISRAIESAQGFEFYRVKDIKIPTIEEAKKDITAILSRPLYEQLLVEYKKNLFDQSSIIYLQ